ncbi:calcium-binding protein [Fodinisporobacter ferrooxydans]|uniref:Calcium-binding protein n=1 Tax=Fodinisporobacter ferrooxydans TaxID=2901836 RepID=A0ABY4CR33_9BACL|nr:calcium-binding protein [Alicyclobacillaceae bacterium MYW30-H2]
MVEPWERRVADILGIDINRKQAGEISAGLPEVSMDNLERYQLYLKHNLNFPFEATFDLETGPFETTSHRVKVIGLEDMIDDFYGLLCTAKEGRRKRIVAVAEPLVLAKTDPNYQLIDDYLSWFCNYR